MIVIVKRNILVMLVADENNYIELNIGVTKVVSVKLDIDVVNELDKMIKRHNFKSRSEFIREALNLYIKLLNIYSRKELKKIVENELRKI